MSEFTVRVRDRRKSAALQTTIVPGERWLVVAWTLITFGVALLVFSLTVAPDLSWANQAYDGGELITASHTLGVAHPPGYPTYSVLGKLFATFPLGSIAYRYNLMSAVTVAAASAFVALTLMTNKQVRLAKSQAAAIALTVVFLPAVWSQATVAEVYGLNLIVVGALLFSILAWERPGFSGFFLGLALTTHPTSLLLIPLTIILTPRSGWRRLPGGVAVGLMPLLLLPLLASTGSPVVWGEPASVAGWWWLITAQLYGANLALLSIRELVDKPAFVSSVVVMLASLGVALVSMLQARKREPASGARTTTLTLAITASMYAVFVLLYDVPDSALYLLPAFLLMAVAAGPLLERARLSLWLLPLFLLAAGWSQQDLSHDRAIRPAAEALFEQAPEGAIIMTPGDRTIFTLWYFHHVEGWRPDLMLVDENLFAFDWYREQLSFRYPTLNALSADNLDRFRSSNGADFPVCQASLVQPDGTPSATLQCGETFR